MKLTIDFETRSACDIRKHGSWVYSEHPSTEPLCLAYKMDVWGKPELWTPKQDPIPTELFDNINIADTIEAHNMSFELGIWSNVMTPRFHWPELPFNKLRCSAAKASMHSLPRNLEGACKALGLRVQKDSEGHRLMLKMCKPRNPTKKEFENGWVAGDLLWHEEPAQLERLYQYCMTDILAEECLSEALRDLPERELAIWRLDQMINMRGILADLPSCESMIRMIKEHEERLLKELEYLTGGAVSSASQVAELRSYLLALGVDLPDLTAETVSNALKGENLNDTARGILRIRQSLGRSSAAKYRAIIDRASSDGRVRGSLLYHGAGTGRWSGAGIQPQNFASRIIVSDSPESLLTTICAGGVELFTALYDDDPMAAAGAITRSVLVSSEGKDLLCADYSAIEGRGLAWLAGEEWVLDAYRQGKDLYVVAASSILSVREVEVTKEQRSIGKIAELACGYQGGAGAVRKFGGDAPFRDAVEMIWCNSREIFYERYGKDATIETAIDQEIKDKIVNPWRAARPKTVDLWNGLEEAAMMAVKNPGKSFFFRYIGFKVQKDFLLMRLPSGRYLYYHSPVIMDIRTPWGADKPQVTYMTVNSMTKKWQRTNGYGGKWAENATQALCRDIMADAMLALDHSGYPIVLTVHDEIVAEAPEGFGSVEEFTSIMCEVPAWAAGFPVSAEGWRGKRYKK